MRSKSIFGSLLKRARRSKKVGPLFGKGKKNPFRRKRKKKDPFRNAFSRGMARKGRSDLFGRGLLGFVSDLFSGPPDDLSLGPAPRTPAGSAFIGLAHHVGLKLSRDEADEINRAAAADNGSDALLRTRAGQRVAMILRDAAPAGEQSPQAYAEETVAAYISPETADTRRAELRRSAAQAVAEQRAHEREARLEQALATAARRAGVSAELIERIRNLTPSQRRKMLRELKDID